MTTFMPNAKMPVQQLSAPTNQPQPQYEITDADLKRQKTIADAWKAYCGELDPPLQKMPGTPDDNVLSNRMQAVVDRGTDFLFGKEVEISVELDAPGEAQDLLDTTWGRKEARMPLLQKLAMNGAIAGQAFLRIVPDGDSSFRLVVVDPSTVFVQTMPQDCETVLLYCIQYSSQEKRNGKWEDVYYREEISRVDPSDDDENEEYEDTDPLGVDADVTWSIQHWSRVGDRGLWTASGDPITWPYPFAPLFSCQNLPKPNDYWGMPDITPDLVGVNTALNLVQSCINRNLKLFATPILFATGTGEQVIDIKPGRIIGLPLTESKIVAVNITADIANALAFAENLRSDIDEQSGVPGVATGRIAQMPRGNLSGIAIELLFMPLMKKTDKKQCLYGDLIIQVSKALLVLAGQSDDVDMTLAWQNALPHDDLQDAQKAVILKQLGISNTTLQREMGYDPDEELSLTQSEQSQQLVDYTRGQGLPPPQNAQQSQNTLQPSGQMPGGVG